MSESATHLEDGPIVVGIKPGLPSRIIETAERTAGSMGCEVIFAYVELNSALVELDPTEPRLNESLDPEIDDEMAGVSAALSDMLTAALAGTRVQWSFRVLAGDPASALSRLAADVGSRMLVVGTRRHGPIHRVEAFFAGSVAKSLAMGQSRPVLLVPLNRDAD
ncbi:nucleotide-binding universal stress UspA family protein [Agromyces hippuratus]|uniref:Nucleotide-binding universal stress UspA family protein n=1 Tax=Agromyces hippuratus TaxID=286438 RepID=A0A852WMS9_9MICO|nr:universal stress protein [Agromyces hippuratus]NYG19266.1 nucleotide-binding universal stress UspA family protein [Agromyces hippuratus]